LSTTTKRIRLNFEANTDANPDKERWHPRSGDGLQPSPNRRDVHAAAANHEVYECKAFKGLILKQKRDIVEYAELCYTCLKWGHFTGSPECEGKPCHCGKKHHPLLHYDGQKTAKVFAIHSGIEDPEPGTFADQDSSDNDDDAGEDREPTPEGDPGDPQ
jgi:hypothetical protein